MSRRRKKRLKVGLWCDYGFTLKPTEGIGVFVANLIGGFSELEEPPQLAILVRAGDEHLYDPIIEGAREEIRVISSASNRLARLRSRAGAAWARLARRLESFESKLERLAARLGAWNERLPDLLLLKRLFPPAAARAAGSRRRPPRWELLKVAGVLLLSSISALILLFVELAIGMLRLGGRLVQVFPRRLYRVARAMLDYYQAEGRDFVARRARRDVWILPYVGMPVPVLNCPFIVIVHDLVYRHYPESFTREHYDLLDRTVTEITRAAALCACASDFILETDLRGVLGLPAEKARRVRHAVPRDILSVEPTPEEVLRERLGVKGPFILYPAAFRRYKNHASLVGALAELHRRRQRSLKLVFTGMLPPPPFITEAVAVHGMEEQVCFVDQVSREDLAGLYRLALATVVPTLYEQGSFPVLEAMSLGSPVACSRIQPLLEQHREAPEAMVFFDPLAVESIADAIESIEANREEIRRRQHQAFLEMTRRTWKDVAGDWLEVCYDAAAMHSRKPRSPAAPDALALR